MDTLELAKSLIAFRTEDPPGNEEGCARYLKDQIEDMHIRGSATEVLTFQRGRANLIASFKGDSPGLMMAGHIDVVPAGEGWASSPFAAEVRRGRLYGRGAADMKAGLAVMVSALSSLRDRRRKRGFFFAATGGEEDGFDGVNALVAAGALERADSRWAVVGEPTEMTVVTGHRGTMVLKVTFEGRSAHASQPSLGVNSIENCALFLDELRGFRRTLSGTTDPALGVSLVTPTMIAGGDKSNVIPGSCELTLDCRLIPAHSPYAITKGLKSIAKKLGERVEGFKATIRVSYLTPSLGVPKDSEFVKLCETLSGSPSAVAPYGTEAAVYAKHGIQSVVLGPGSVKQAHTVDEFVTQNQLRLAERVYTRLISDVCL